MLLCFIILLRNEAMDLFSSTVIFLRAEININIRILLIYGYKKNELRVRVISCKQNLFMPCPTYQSFGCVIYCLGNCKLLTEVTFITIPCLHFQSCLVILCTRIFLTTKLSIIPGLTLSISCRRKRNLNSVNNSYNSLVFHAHIFVLT